MTMNKNFDVAQLLKGVEPEDLGLDKYKYIMNSVNKVDVSSDEDFQSRFNNFYVLNGTGASPEWKAAYYAYFQEVKNNPDKQTLETIIRHFYEDENVPPYNAAVNKRIELSFSSKMLATIQPNKPIWDSHVSRFLDTRDPKDIAEAIKKYTDLENLYKSFLNTPDADNWIAAFDSAFPEYKWISKTKKIDFIIWYKVKKDK